MKTILVPVGAMPRTGEIDGSLKSMQETVGGNIELCSWVFDDRPTVYVNEEGKFAGQPNRAVYAMKAGEAASNETAAKSWKETDHVFR